MERQLRNDLAERVRAASGDAEIAALVATKSRDGTWPDVPPEILTHLKRKYAAVYAPTVPRDDPVAIGYVRYSCEKTHPGAENPGVEHTVEVQKASIRHFALKRLNAPVTDPRMYVDEAQSGASHARAQWQQLLHDWILVVPPGHKAPADYLVGFDSSRLLRDYPGFVMLSQECRARGVRIFESQTGHELTDDAMVTYALAMAFARDIGRRDASATARSHAEQRAREGLAVGGCPYGYRTMALGGGNGRIVVPDPQTSAIVIDIFLWRSMGWSLRQIAQHLNDAGIPSPRSSRFGWAKNTISSILDNEAYIGVAMWGKTHREKRVGSS